jgi:hypothetical protein
MSRPAFRSPTLELEITPEQYEKAVQSASGGCLIADAIKDQYPHLSGITVDMATIRASDKKKGLRYVYLTPPAAQHMLLSFDQGWPQSADQVVVRSAVKVLPITRTKAQAEARAARLAELEEKEKEGTLTTGEAAALGRIRKGPKKRAAKKGKSVANGNGTTVYGGTPPVQGPPHPNLLRGRNRHFGAKLADPGEAFNNAVEAAVAAKLAGET